LHIYLFRTMFRCVVYSDIFVLLIIPTNDTVLLQIINCVDSEHCAMSHLEECIRVLFVFRNGANRAAVLVFTTKLVTLTSLCRYRDARLKALCSSETSLTRR
jgi:hypothetical protein